MSPGLVQTVTAGPHIPAPPASLRIPGPDDADRAAAVGDLRGRERPELRDQRRVRSLDLGADRPTGWGCDLLMVRGC